MSPRSEEFITQARDHVAGARTALEAGYSAVAVSAAYYAMLYAARAALSEEDLNARTHRGTWSLFRETFVDTGRLDPDLLREARKAERLREGADYDARTPPREEAEEILAEAERFVAAIAELLGG